jgi:HD superfamily phosphohydrolase
MSQLHSIAAKKTCHLLALLPFLMLQGVDLESSGSIGPFAAAVDVDYHLKIFNDPIHGNISFNPACVAIIDTPEFQRLRHLKQLGAGYWVYPGAGHNRFEHSLGVCYLAGQFVRHLKNQDGIEITDKDVLCVEIAGLCHDLGHGPFSHTFDGKFIRSVVPRTTWKHEDASKKLFGHLVQTYELIEEGGVLRKHGLTREDVEFIKELISPKAWGPSREWLNNGRDREKAFLYEIVANKRNGIDVDKFDYLARDCYQLGIQNNFDHKRFFQFTRVIEVDGQRQICLRDKEVLNLYNLFLTRYTLHKVAYQHAVVSAINLMLARAMIKADEYISITKSNGRKRKMSECIHDMEAYTQLNDSIIFKILYTESDGPNRDMDKAQKLIRRVFRRELYKCVYESPPIDPERLSTVMQTTEEDIKRDVVEIARAASPQNQDKLMVEIVKLDFGKGAQNPMESLKVFSRYERDTGRNITRTEVSRIMAFNYTEWLVRVYNRRARPTEPAAREVYDGQSNIIGEACKRWFENLPAEVRADGVPSRPDPDGGAQVPTTSG